MASSLTVSRIRAGIRMAFTDTPPYIQQDEYLSKHRGEYAQRGGVFLPVVNRPGAYEAAEVCAACGDIAVVRKGQAMICQTCGVRAARASEDQTG